MSTRGAAVREEMNQRTARCQAIAADNAELINMGSAANLEMPHPIYIERADGARAWDADGNEYLDTMLGFGTHVMGHNFAPVKEAVLDQMERGWHYGIHNPNQETLARLIQEAMPSAERVIFCNSGTESTMYAFRVARAFTGKNVVATFDGFYHGAHDYGMVQALPGSDRHNPQKFTMGAGIPQGVVDAQMILPYRDRAAFDMIRQHANELALVAIEPVQSSNPQKLEDTAEFLSELIEVCRANKVLVMFDEVITGFRIGFGGVQAKLDLKPDITTLAKTIGAGFPVGAVAGRAEIIELFQGIHRGDGRGVFSGGTFSGNPVTMVAGAALVQHLKDHQDEVYPYIDQAGDTLCNRINAYARSHNMPVQMLNAGSMFQLYFQAEPVTAARDIRNDHAQANADFYLHLLANGVIIPGTHRAFLSAAHTTKDMDQMATAIEKSLDAVREDSLI